jgi:Na+-transporting methylmalonyl-CoA/oxaloacetate decarboxylase gamma subunit
LSANIEVALLITIIGMGLVFAAILLLWGVMALLVHFSTEAEPQRVPDDVQESDELKKKAAVIAVAAALAIEMSYQPHEFPLPPTATVSAWQSVMRSAILKRGRIR